MLDSNDDASFGDSTTASDGEAAFPMPIVGIGASAGGVGALCEFFRALPTPSDENGDDRRSGPAYIVVLHLSPDKKSSLAEILQQETTLDVRSARDGHRVQPNTVYVMAPAQRLTIDDGALCVDQLEEAHDPLSIDRFLRSLASDQGKNAVGIVLSGSGTDGALGLRAIKEVGGITLVQLPEEADYVQMPESAIATGIVDLVLPVAELATRLAEYRDQAGVIQLPEDEEALAETDQSTLTKILATLREVTGHDFSGYKRSMVLRRLERRLQLSRTETLLDYLALMQSSPAEAQAFEKDLLISVTSFFRDPESYKELEKSVLPELFKGKEAGDSVRVWVPGCATGEEAYSLAMLLVEQAERLDSAAPPDIQVFATDLDADALAFGRRAQYPKAIEADVPSDRLERFFVPDGERYRVNHDLREHVLFAEHNLLEDPPFSNLDLVSCRNLLIYLGVDLQRYVYRLIHYGLRDRGFLFLGRSEALGKADHMFEVLDASNNILRARDLPKGNTLRTAPTSFLRRQSYGRTPPNRRPFSGEETAAGRFRSSALDGGHLVRENLGREGQDTVRSLHHQAMMEEVASVLVTENREIVHVSGSADRYLQFGEGVPTTDLLACVPERIRSPLRRAMHQALDNDETVHRSGIDLTIDNESRRVSLSARPLEKDGVRYVHVRFEDLVSPDAAAPSATASESTRETELREDMERTRDQLQTTAEEHEAVVEEMETANEELLSMNEELQSKNEELETNKEELQSVNEELKATNRELKSSINEVRRSKGVLENLMSATDVVTLFLDSNLRVFRFTPAAASLFDLSDADIGAPFFDFARDLNQDHLFAEARRAFRTEESIELEVRRAPDEWYLARLRPYRTIDGEVTGVVLNLVDITERRMLEREVLDTTEKVRRQIGQDLHDILSSDLTALALMLDNYRDRLEGGDVDLDPLRDMTRRVHLAADRARTLSHALVPVALQEENLAAALEELCTSQAEVANISLRFEGDRKERFPRNKETAGHLYRITKEAITNARRHAGAEQVRVRLRRTNGCLELSIQDDGDGLPDDLDEARGLGIRTMRYRAHLVGATLLIESGTESWGDAGTTILCTLPLNEAGAAQNKRSGNDERSGA